MVLNQLWLWVVKTYFNIAGLKLFWDFLNRLYKKFYSERVILELYIAWESPAPEKPLRKAIFFTIKNQTSKPVTFTQFWFVDSLYRRFFPQRPQGKFHFSKPIATVEPGKRFMVIIDYFVNNLMFYTEGGKYVGIESETGHIYWLSRRQLKATIKEFRTDFPDAKPFEGKPREYQNYKADAQALPK